MRCSQSIPINTRKASANSPLAKALAPEDVRAGDYVTVLHVLYELPSFLWCADATLLPPEELVRLRFIPQEGGLPLKVISVCLPFVLVKCPLGRQCTIDIRRSTLARLDRKFAKSAWKTLKKSRSKQRRNNDFCTS